MQPLITVPLTKREQFPLWLHQQGLKRLCEVGVLQGQNFLHLLSSGPERLLGVDPWKAENWAECEVAQETFDAMYEQLRTITAQHPCVELRRCTSIEAAAQEADESFDFVYIDGEHTYEAACGDIAAWWPKVRCGGYLAGHDYCMRINRVTYGVIQAVHEHAGREGLSGRVYHTFNYEHEGSPSWLLQKPGK